MDPITLIVGGAAIAYLLGGKSGAPAPPTQPGGKIDPCSPEAAQQYALAGIQGGASGAAMSGGNPYAAGAGAGLAVISNPGFRQCGRDKLNHAKKELCKKANKLKDEIERKFGTIGMSDSKWDKLSCDEKIAYMAALGPYGTAALLAGTIAIAGWNTTKKEVERWAENAKDAADKIGEQLSDPAGTVESWGKKAGKAFGL